MLNNLAPSWKKILEEELNKEYFQSLKSFLLLEQQKGFSIYPPTPLIFNSFKLTSFEDVKVVILGQDPYHGKDQAHGLSFSVPRGQKVPPSLKNIYKELALEFPNFITPKHGNLTAWAKQGVLMLNATLTVRASEAGSHQDRGWEIFTDHVIKILSKEKQALVFLLWGNYAQRKEDLIDKSKHLVLKAAHPSPFSANRGFFGCNHFIKTNDQLKDKGLTPINWQITDEWVLNL